MKKYIFRPLILAAFAAGAFFGLQNCKDEDDPGSDDLIKDVDGNVYTSVTIGNQVWLKENLKTTRYQNGDAISTTNPATKDILTENAPQYQWPTNGVESDVPVFGRLYTDFVARDPRNVCPTGWSVPSESDFIELTSYLISEGYNFDDTRSGNKIAKALASTTNWTPYTLEPGVPGNDLITNNESGFSGLPTGNRINFDVVFLGKGVYTMWWSSSIESDMPKIFRIQNFQQSADIGQMGDRNAGLPIRCIKNP
ncbi:MAG: fibrobacter succinogenes major paralogous domain-containing protein [Cyclobacteriaceae bacterium]|jgi:uncharacterized protein (TIGR02145 family)